MPHRPVRLAGPRARVAYPQSTPRQRCPYAKPSCTFLCVDMHGHKVTERYVHGYVQHCTYAKLFAALCMKCTLYSESTDGCISGHYYRQRGHRRLPALLALTGGDRRRSMRPVSPSAEFPVEIACGFITGTHSGVRPGDKATLSSRGAEVPRRGAAAPPRPASRSWHGPAKVAPPERGAPLSRCRDRLILQHQHEQWRASTISR